MLAIQLDLFSGKPVAPSFEGAKAFDDAAKRAGIYDDLVLNPCKNCSLRDFCSDDCAQHLYDVDVEVPEYEDFEDWLYGSI